LAFYPSAFTSRAVPSDATMRRTIPLWRYADFGTQCHADCLAFAVFFALAFPMRSLFLVGNAVRVGHS
jgi:hypothetical protein